MKWTQFKNPPRPLTGDELLTQRLKELAARITSREQFETIMSEVRTPVKRDAIRRLLIPMLSFEVPLDD